MRRLVLLLAAGLVLPASAIARAEADATPEPLRGRVVLLSKVLAQREVAADPEPIAGQVVLEAEDGTVTALLPNEASRALFRDERLRDRRAEVEGSRVEGLPYFRVVAFRVEEDGELRTPEYHCEVCTINLRAPQDCPCCQGPMELRFRPVGSR